MPRVKSCDLGFPDEGLMLTGGGARLAGWLHPLGQPSLAATLVIAPPLAGLLWASGTVTIAAAAISMMLFVWVVMSAGFLLLRAAHAGDLPASAAWVLGLFATAIVLYALTVAFGLLAASAFAIWAVVILALGFFFREPAPAARRMELPEWLGLALC